MNIDRDNITISSNSRMNTHSHKYGKCYMYCLKSILYTALLFLLSQWLMANLNYIENYLDNVTKSNISDIFHDVLSHTNTWDINYDWDIIAPPENLKMDDPRLIKKLLHTFKTTNGQRDFNNPPNTKMKAHDLVPLLLDSVSNKTDGFFIEFGAGDGVTMSPTLQLEKQYNWHGLLVEAEMKIADQLLHKRRSSFVSNTCLGVYNKSYTAFLGIRKHFGSKLIGDKWDSYDYLDDVFCYPLYTYLLSLRRTNIDLIIIDINNNELEVLKSIPFNKVQIDVLVVRYRTIGELKNVTEFIVQKNYIIFGTQKKTRYIICKYKKINK